MCKNKHIMIFFKKHVINIRIGLITTSKISGVTNAGFIRAAINAQRVKEDKLSVRDFIAKLDEKMGTLDMPEEMAERYLNEGFSGGEKMVYGF